jgi:hypothetical protein
MEVRLCAELSVSRVRVRSERINLVWWTAAPLAMPPGRPPRGGDFRVNSNRTIRASWRWTRRGVVRGRLPRTRGPEP